MPAQKARTAETARGWKAAAALLGIGGFLLLGNSLGEHYWDNVRTHGVENCLYKEGPPGRENAKSSNFRVIWWPLGVRCAFLTGPDDRNPVTTQSDWGLTLAALIGAAGMAASVAIPGLGLTRETPSVIATVDDQFP